ncbi:hypothetical protein ACFX13_039941 [Malus domestica]
MKERAAKRLRNMATKEMCLMMERVIYTEEELQDIPIKYQDMRDYMKEIYVKKKEALMAKNSGFFSRDGGGWPSTVARSP